MKKSTLRRSDQHYNRCFDVAKGYSPFVYHPTWKVHNAPGSCYWQYPNYLPSHSVWSRIFAALSGIHPRCCFPHWCTRHLHLNSEVKLWNGTRKLQLSRCVEWRDVQISMCIMNTYFTTAQKYHIHETEADFRVSHIKNTFNQESGDFVESFRNWFSDM